MNLLGDGVIAGDDEAIDTAFVEGRWDRVGEIPKSAGEADVCDAVAGVVGSVVYSGKVAVGRVDEEASLHSEEADVVIQGGPMVRINPGIKPPAASCMKGAAKEGAAFIGGALP